MARTKNIPVTNEYGQIRQQIAATGDDNACFPAAIAVLADLPFETVQKAFAEAGRQTGKATMFSVAHEACKALGFQLKKLPTKWELDMIYSYPGVHKNLKNITTRHPVRFAKAWAGQSVLLHVNGHVAAVKDGKMHDWSINRSMHVMAVYQLVKIDQ